MYQKKSAYFDSFTDSTPLIIARVVSNNFVFVRALHVSSCYSLSLRQNSKNSFKLVIIYHC